MVCHSLLQWTTFCQTSPPWPAHLGWPHTACGFIELDKAVVRVIRLASFLWYGFSVSALWCPLATPTILFGFLLPWTCGISSRLLQESAATAPYLGWVTPPDLQHGLAPFSCHSLEVGLLLLAATPDLQNRVAPLSHCPWPRAWVAPQPLLAVLSQPGALSTWMQSQKQQNDLCSFPS